MQEIYNPEPSESAKLNTEKLALRRRLNEITEQENKVDPKIIEAKKQSLARAVQMHKKEKQLSDQALALSFSQMTSPEGFIFKEKK